MGDPTSSYATAVIAHRILEALKPPHPDLPFLRQGGDVIEGVITFIIVRSFTCPVIPMWYCFGTILSIKYIYQGIWLSSLKTCYFISSI